MACDLWIEALSITMTEFGAGNRFILSRRISMKEVKDSVVNEKSRTSRWRMPLRDRAGSIEYLRCSEYELAMIEGCDNDLFPQTKKSL
jgi:hypothetical protein